MRGLRLIYSTLMLLAPLIVLPVFMFFTRGRQRIWDRLGFWNCNLDSCIWVHGASLGETAGLAPIVREIKKVNPALKIFGTSTSPTASAKLAQFCSNVRILPFDHPLFFSRCIKKINPTVFITTEKEIWPNLLRYLDKRSIPVLLVNGIISESSFAKYQRLGSLYKEALQVPDFIYAADSKSAQHFLELGVSADKLQLISNTKYDQPVAKDLGSNHKADRRKLIFAEDARLVVFASLRPGEEQVVFEAIQKSEHQKINFIVAPRHQEKFGFFESALKSHGLKYQKRSEQASATTSKLLYLDTHGELADLLSLADLAFVGGTLVNGYGGHNPLEAAQFSVPLISGPYDYNIKYVVSELQLANAAVYVKNSEDLLNIFKYSDSQLLEMGINAKNVCNSFAGSSKIIADRILSGR